MSVSRATRLWLAALALVATLGTDHVARGDAMPERPACPRVPHDGAACGAFPAGTSCRYRSAGVVCECQRVVIDGRRRSRWSCGELGE